MDHRLIEGLMEVIAPLIKSYVDERIAKDVAPLHAKIAEYQAAAPEKGEPGLPGKDIDPGEVAAMVASEVAKAFEGIEKPADGTSVTVDDVRPVLAEMVAALPIPKDGKSVDLADVEAMVELTVEKAISALPPAPAGEPGKSVDIQDLIPVIAAEVESAVAGIASPKDGEPGAPGAAGKSITVDDVRPLLEEMVSAIAPAKDGKSADPVEVAALIIEDVAKLIPVPADGKSVTVDDVLPLLEEMVEKRVSELPTPVNGKDGLDGKDGKDGIGMAGAVLGRSGELVMTFSDGTTKDLGVIVGKDGEPGRPGENGKDGFSLKDFDTELLADGRTVLLKFCAGDVMETHELVFPVVLDQGVFKDGEAYQRGDGVTFGGSFWIAQKDGPEGKPQDGSKDWRLAVKRGRNGADGVVRQLPPQGPVKA